MINNNTAASRLVMDPESTRSMSELARKDPKEAVRQVAGQFEAMLMGQLMSSMRESSLDTEDDSQEMGTYRGMYDQQIVQTLVQAGGFGLADALSGYLLKSMPQEADAAAEVALPQAAALPAVKKALSAYQAQDAAAASSAATATPAIAQPAASPVTTDSNPLPAGKAAFVEALLPHARQAAARLGVAPEVLVGHAALESGWGQRAIRHPDGRQSYNLFGIKATPSWQGDTVATLTTEYQGGVAQKQVDTFRAYPSMSAAFDDYAKLLASNPRYQGALNQGQNSAAFASALQRGGYATDPAYAQKLQAVIRTVASI